MFPGNGIKQASGPAQNSSRFYPIVIVGAGHAGIGMGCQLRAKLGFDQFRIFEKQSSIGGTWSSAKGQYPGIRCDVPAVFYSFSFCPNDDWSDPLPSGPSVLSYLQNVVDEYQLVDKIQLNTGVEEAVWVESEQLWKVTLAHYVPRMGDLSGKQRQEMIVRMGQDKVYLGFEVIRCKIFITAAGGLADPNTTLDSIPGHESFGGEIVHSALWNRKIDVRDKKVVVVGAACSASQIVPEIIEPSYGAESVVQIMRTPPWVVPRVRSPIFQKEWDEWRSFALARIPLLALTLRFLTFVATELDFNKYFGMEEKNRLARDNIQKKLLRYMKKTAPEKYHRVLTPDYSFCCKRRVFDSGWLASLHDSRVELTTSLIKRLEPGHVVLGEDRGRRVPADMIILANGYNTSTWLHHMHIVGRDDHVLQEVWKAKGGPYAYLGNQVDGFPNFFIIFGPNTATGHSSVILAIENMVLLSLKFIEPILRGEAKTCEIKKQAAIDYADDMQHKLSTTVFNQGGCINWYKTDDWNATVYPYSQTNFGLRCMFPDYRHWDITYTRKGLAMLWLRRIARASAVVVLVATAVRMQRQKEGPVSVARNLVRGAVDVAISLLYGLRDAL